MNVTFTARHFRPHADVKELAVAEVKKLGKFYDGIVRASVVLSFERATNSVKTAEVPRYTPITRRAGAGMEEPDRPPPPACSPVSDRSRLMPCGWSSG